MAFNQKSDNASNNNNFKKADAWINVSINSKDGSTSKQIGGVPVYADTDLGKWLLNREGGIEGLSLSVDMHVVQAKDTNDLEALFG